MYTGAKFYIKEMDPSYLSNDLGENAPLQNRFHFM